MKTASTQIRVIWLTENYYPNKGGMAQSCDRIVHNLRNQGILVDVMHFSNRVEHNKIENVQNGKNIALAMHPDIAHSLNLVWAFIENYQEELNQNQQVVITHLVAFGGYVPLLAAPIFSAWLQVPYIVLLRGNDFDTGIFSLKRQEILKNALRQAAKVCVVSKDKQYKINKLFPEVKVSHIPNGINLNEWALLASDQQKAKDWRSQQVPLTQDTPKKVLGMFGHLKSKKGVLFFLEALKLSGKLTHIHLLIVGDMTEAVQNFLDTHPTLTYTHYPFMERFALLPYYAACDLVAIPSYYDGLPNVLMEAGGLGIPFIASEVAGMADFLINQTHGFLFKPGNMEQCRDAIRQMFTSPMEKLKEMGKNCKAMVQDKLNDQHETKLYVQVLQEILH